MDFILPGIVGHYPAKHLHIGNFKDRVSWFQARIPSSTVEQDNDKQFDNTILLLLKDTCMQLIPTYYFTNMY